MLRAALDEDEQGTGPMPTASREIYRSLYDLDRRGPLCERYRRVATSRQANQRDRVHAPREYMTLAGKRIAIVGGHDSTRLRVREQLSRLGARVDDVAPATSGRVNERDILDRVRLCDLVVLVVTYMGHDMSTIVSNLSARGALAGQVLPVECRGATGVTRAVTEWAQVARAMVPRS